MYTWKLLQHLANGQHSVKAEYIHEKMSQFISSTCFDDATLFTWWVTPGLWVPLERDHHGMGELWGVYSSSMRSESQRDVSWSLKITVKVAALILPDDVRCSRPGSSKIGSQRSTPKDIMTQETISLRAGWPLIENIICRKAELVSFLNIIYKNALNSLSY